MTSRPASQVLGLHAPPTHALSYHHSCFATDFTFTEITNLSTTWTQLKKDFAVTPELEEITETCKDFITICTGELPILTVENQI